MKRLFKDRTGTVLTEALISMFILGTLFISIATAVTASISNTRRLQEVNETSAYAQKVADCIYAIAESDSGAFFQEVEKTYEAYLEYGDFSYDCYIDLFSIAIELDYMKENGADDVVGIYDILNFDIDSGTGTGEDEIENEYDVRLYLLPSEKSDVHKSVNYFVSYNPLLTENPDGGRIFNTEELSDIYTFKLVVSKKVVTSQINADFTKSSPATVTYIFQISSNGGR